MAPKPTKLQQQQAAPSLDGESSASFISFLWMPEPTFPPGQEDFKSSEDAAHHDDSAVGFFGGAHDSAAAVVAGRGDDDGEEQDGGCGHTARSLEMEVMALKLRLAEACTSDGRHSNEARTLALERDGLLERVDRLTEREEERRVAAELARAECMRLRVGMKRLRAENDQLKVENERMEDMVTLLEEKVDALTRERERLLKARPFRAARSWAEDGLEGNLERDDDESDNVERENDIPDGIACDYEQSQDPLDKQQRGPSRLRSFEVEAQHVSPMKLFLRSRVHVFTMEADDHDSDSVNRCDNNDGECKNFNDEGESDNGPQAPSTDDKVEMGNSADFSGDSSIFEQKDCAPGNATKGGHSQWSLFGKRIDDKRESDGETCDRGSLSVKSPTQDGDNGTETEKEDAAALVQDKEQSSPWGLFGRKIGEASEGPTADGERQDDRGTGQGDNVKTTWQLFGRRVHGNQVIDHIDAEKQDGANGTDGSNANDDCNIIKDASSISARLFHKRNNGGGYAKYGFVDSCPGEDKDVHQNRSFQGLGFFGWRKNDLEVGKCRSERNVAGKKNINAGLTATTNNPSGMRAIFQTSRSARGGRAWKSDHHLSASQPNAPSRSLRNLFGKQTNHDLDDANVGSYENFAMDNDNGDVISSVHAGRSMRDVFRSMNMMKSKSDPNLFTCEDSLSEEYSDIVARRTGTGQDGQKNRGGTGEERNANGSAEVWGRAVTWNRIRQEDAKHQPILRRRSVELYD